MGLLRTASKALFASADVFLKAPPGPRILIYHRVGTPGDLQMEVSENDFRWQLEWLSRNREVVDLDSALSRWEESTSGKLVVLTFDDGYPDTYDTAFPLLKDYGFPFTVYLATDSIGMEDRSGQALTWAQIEEMLCSGLLTVGAHTEHHLDLRITSLQRIAEEVGASNQEIASRLGVRPRHFAYPWGYWSEEADAVVRTSYESAALGAPPLNRPARFDPFLIHRFPIQLSDGRRWFRARLVGGLLMEEEIRRRLRGYAGP